jgi:trans-aconitate methyltransferase
MTPDDRWLATVWPFVRDQPPSAPATVLEVGCGPLGGVVPALLDGGYDAVGVDPEAPEGSDYQQVELERYQPPWPVECVVASTSLHHVTDLDEVLDRLAVLLVPGGCWWWSGPGSGSTRPSPAGASPG